MADSTDNFTNLVPGFDFLQGLVKNAGAAMPSIGQWVAPTLDPDDLEKRIEELRTVQFWLEQNARMLAATIEALEVQRMTLSTLKAMNVPLAQLRESLKVREPAPAPAAPAAAPAAAAQAPAAAKNTKSKRKEAGTRKASADASATPAVDPMQWWGALTQQFTELATAAMKEGAGDSARTLAASMVKQSYDAAEQTLRDAVATSAAAAGTADKAAAKKGSAASAQAATPAAKTAASGAAKAVRKRTRKS